MKITQTQIKALATKLAREINAQITIKNKELTSEANFEKWQRNNLSLVNAIKDTFKYGIVWAELTKIENYNKPDYNIDLMQNCIEKEFLYSITKLDRVSENSLIEDILIETIECENLNDIMESIKSKYI